jgi:DnaK suppressor protein
MDDARALELLAAERARIEHALGALAPGEHEEATDPLDDDTAPELVREEIAEGVARTLQDELEAVARAEQRLGEGTYGLSVESGEPIPDGRLEVVPWAERTAEEQSRYERGT